MLARITLITGLLVCLALAVQAPAQAFERVAPGRHAGDHPAAHHQMRPAHRPSPHRAGPARFRPHHYQPRPHPHHRHERRHRHDYHHDRRW